MNKLNHHTYLEDFERINNGYSPKKNLISLYNIFVLGVILKLFIYKESKKIIAGLFNYGKMHKQGHNIFPLATYDKPR